MNLNDQVRQYIEFKRALGRKYVNEEYALYRFADYAMSCGDRFTRVETMIGWAYQTPSPSSVNFRLSIVGGFADMMHAEDPRHQVLSSRPAPGVSKTRRSPQLLTQAQIGQLIDAALELPPVDSISPHTYHYLIGLMAVTGLRVSEAIALRVADVTDDGLLVLNTKFRKSRLVPLHDSTREALDRYLKLRGKFGVRHDHLFILSTGNPPSRTTVCLTFIKLARQLGFRGPAGEPGTRLHDLRHAFATRSVENALRTDRDSVNTHMFALSAYLGHVCPTSTHWYLEATPALLEQIAVETEKQHIGRAKQ